MLDAMRLRVRFAETDQMGVAHHSAYVVWLEAGRVEWLRRRGLSYRAIEDRGVSLAVSGLQIDYRSAARFDDEIEVDTRLVEARSRRFRFRYRLCSVPGGTLLARATTLHTPTDRSGRAIRLPGEWLGELSKMVQAEEAGPPTGL